MKKARLTLTSHELILIHWCLVCRIDNLIYDEDDKDFSAEAEAIIEDIENLLNKIKKKMPDIKYIKQRF